MDGASSFRMNRSNPFLASVMQASEDDLTVTQDHMSVTTVNTLDGMTDSLRENLVSSLSNLFSAAASRDLRYRAGFG